MAGKGLINFICHFVVDFYSEEWILYFIYTSPDTVVCLHLSFFSFVHACVLKNPFLTDEISHPAVHNEL